MSTLGFNTGYIEELYRQYLQDPDSVGESWKEFFQDFTPDEGFIAVTEARAVPTEPTPDAKAEPKSKPVSEDYASEKPIRGPSATIVENMQASLEVPTATSVRTVPVKLMAENRTLINEHQRLVGGNKVSFYTPHRLGYRAGDEKIPVHEYDISGRR